ncbi:hypothetical protein CROQUDRAFT_90046 [Cronartium quercuum f. sp. fusiforme G11]|uniref:Uncharacterized protein n=1 Tax=Cronartium quercuum f. sp. fusiforme G11 TaxID=708437 RepID=A0A9P6TDN9_9BASI|nr:hypothetical protein CROQUDRAFT_90046 [Cronartium quercuum f. sp. fusiforme G11]
MGQNSPILKKPSPNLPRSSPKSPAEILESNASAEELFAHSQLELLRRSGRL